MADSLNRWQGMGALGADPELRTTQGGQSVLSLRMATNDSYQDRDGVARERTDWHDVVIWGKRGEALAKFMKRGDRLMIEGPIRSRTWDKPDGSKGYATEIHATEVWLLGGNRGGASEPGDTGGGYTRRPGDAPRGGPAPARGGGRGGAPPPMDPIPF